MSLEERIELHDQWLRSMESNQSQFAANLAEFQRETRQQFSRIREILEQLTLHQAALSPRIDRLADYIEAAANQVRQLSETVDRYIRFRGNGNEPN